MLTTLLSESPRVDYICLGDSITGWNNFGNISTWPFPTYPSYLAEKLSLRDNPSVLNAGIAGDLSINAEKMVRYCLGHFPEAKVYVIGYGTNDLAEEEDIQVVSGKIIGSLEKAIDLLIRAEKKVVLFNVPYLNFPFPSIGKAKKHDLRRKDYHNQKLVERFSSKLTMVDICSHLKPQHFGDTLHPNAEGAELIASLIYTALEKVQQVGQATTSAGL